MAKVSTHTRRRHAPAASPRFRLAVDVRRPHATRGRIATVYTTGAPAEVLAALARALGADPSRCWYRLAPEFGGRGRFRLEAAEGMDPVRWWALSPVLAGTTPGRPVAAHPSALMLPATFLKALEHPERAWRLAARG
jgi:hypothetical protein